jgi:hypothetical protein
MVKQTDSVSDSKASEPTYVGQKSIKRIEEDHFPIL